MARRIIEEFKNKEEYEFFIDIVNSPFHNYTEIIPNPIDIKLIEVEYNNID